MQDRAHPVSSKDLVSCGMWIPPEKENQTEKHSRRWEGYPTERDLFRDGEGIWEVPQGSHWMLSGVGNKAAWEVWKYFWNIKFRSLVWVPKLTGAPMGIQVWWSSLTGEASATKLPVPGFLTATVELRKLTRPFSAGRCDGPWLGALAVEMYF